MLPVVNTVKGEPIRQMRTMHTRPRPDSLISPVADSTFLARPFSAQALLAPEIRLNRQATVFAKSFIRHDEEELSIAKERGKLYFRLMDSIFTQYGLPTELKYLAVVESNLKPGAVSRVGAKGLWQLMPTTARELGLHITKKYDERTQVYKSTVAAAKYLRDLYSSFGDWLLVMAAYNSGPGTVDQAIRRSGSRNFWAMQRFLPEESRSHVKRFIGTHYYFEGKGGMTTLTKSETLAYMKKLESFNASLDQNKNASHDSLASIASTNR